MENNDNSWAITAFIITLIGSLIWIGSNNSKISRLEDENITLQDSVDQYDRALDEANSNIEEVNSRIDEAKYSTWDNYESMGDALDSLDTVDTVPKP